MTRKTRIRRTLECDSVASVLINLDKQTYMLTDYRRDRNSDAELTELADLRAKIAILKAENEHLAERLADELDRLDERLARLECDAHHPWWRRVFTSSEHDLEVTDRAGRKAARRLRAVCLDRAVLNASQPQRRGLLPT